MSSWSKPAPRSRSRNPIWPSKKARYADNFIVAAHPNQNIVTQYEFRENEAQDVVLMYQENTGLWTELPDDPQQGDFRTSILTIMPSVDIDVDSDNTATPTWHGIDRSDCEEQIENEAEYPGKLVLFNNNDDNNNEIPDYLENADYEYPPGMSWVPFPDPDLVPVVLDRGFADLTGMDGFVFELKVTIGAERGLSYWLDQQKTPIIGSAYDPDDWDEFEEAGKMKRVYHWVVSDEEVNYPPLIYVEGVNPEALTDTLIWRLFDPDEEEIDVDTVKMTDPHRVDLDIDSDNTSRFAGPSRSRGEDAIENVPGETGKWVPPNHGDIDNDGILDLWDGYSIGAHDQAAPNASQQFVPIVVELSPLLPLAGLTMSFDYAMLFTVPPVDISVAPSELSGKIRIWTKDGTEARNGAGVQAGGDFVLANHSYAPVDLGFSDTNRENTFYVEGATLSQHVGTTIKVRVFPDPATGIAEQFDEVRYVVAEAAVYGTIEYGVGFALPVRGARVVAYERPGIMVTQLGMSYTNDRGEYFIRLESVNDMQRLDRIRVFAETRPAGTGVGAEYVHRSVNVAMIQTLPEETYYTTVFDTSIPADVQRRDAATWLLVNPPYVIGNRTFPEAAFWVYDAMVTGSRFHATLPDVDPGHVPAYYPGITAPNASWGYQGMVNINARHYDLYDLIVHEYGHVVAQEAGFFHLPWWPGHWNHHKDRNMRTYHNHKCPNCARLGFSEGWANFYSLAAQEQQGVPRVHPILRGRAGDSAFFHYDQETHSRFHLGEDQEIAVMRLLWDLHDDSPGEAYDRVEYGVNTIYELLRDNQVKTASAFWNLLSDEIPKGPNFMTEMAALADVFVEAGMGTKDLRALINKASGGVSGRHVTWNGGDPEPTFQWEIPFSCFNQQLQLLANIASHQITPGEWSAIRNGRSEIFWTILSGADFGSFQSGWYWSNDVGNTRITISP
jgi:hypothetical protein